jgi:hypothetical protein
MISMKITLEWRKTAASDNEGKFDFLMNDELRIRRGNVTVCMEMNF